MRVDSDGALGMPGVMHPLDYPDLGPGFMAPRPTSTALNADGTRLYVASAHYPGLFVFDVADDGTLTQRQGPVDTAGGSRWSQPWIQLVSLASGDFLFVNNNERATAPSSSRRSSCRREDGPMRAAPSTARAG
jgi:hypothetical protein